MFTTSNITILGYAVITREEFGNLSDFDWWQVEVPICLEREIQLQSLGMFCISEFILNLCIYSCLTFNKPIRTVASLVFQKVKKFDVGLRYIEAISFSTKELSFPRASFPPFSFNHLFFQHVRQESWLPSSPPLTKEARTFVPHTQHEFTSLISRWSEWVNQSLKEICFWNYVPIMTKHLDLNINIITFNSLMFAILQEK